LDQREKALRIKHLAMCRLRISWGVLLLVVVGWDGVGQVVVTPPPAPPPVRPGDTLTLPFIVKNISTERDIFEFSLDAPAGLDPLGVPEPLELDPNAQETVFVSFVVTPRARAGAHSITLRARSRRNPSIVSQASVTVTVSAVPGLELTPPRPQAVEPGSSAKLLFLLRNTGNVADRVALAAQSPFPVTVPAGEIPLDVGERREIPIEIKIPKGAPSARVRVTLQATSRLFQISATATAVVEILPPLPQDVKGTLFLTIPSEVGFQIEGQTGLTLSASIAIRELGGALVPDRPAVRLNVGGSLNITNTSSGTITVTVSDGRPPITIAPAASAPLSFPTSGIFTVAVSDGALLPSAIIVAVQDLLFRQRLSGRGAVAQQGQLSYLLDLQNLFELNAISFELDTKPVGIALGDLSRLVSSLATLRGRGGQLSVQPGFFDATFSVAMLTGGRLAPEIELRITDDASELPPIVTVSLNQPVRFRNVGLTPHSVAIPSAGSVLLAPGQSFVYIFTALGQVTVTIDTTSVTFLVIAEAFCSASFLLCLGAEGHGSVLPGVTVGQAALFGYASSSLITTLLHQIRWQIPGGSVTAVEGGLTWQNGTFLDSALRASSELRFGDFFVAASVLRAGRDFVGDRRDEQSLQIVQSFSSPNLSLGLLFERARTNVANDPLQQTFSRQEARAFLSLKLSEVLPTVRLSAAYSSLIGTGPLPPTGLERFAFTLQAIQPLGRLGDVSVFTEQARLVNSVAGTEIGFGTVGSDFSLRLPELRAALRLEHRSQVDLLSSALVSQALIASAGVELLRRPFSVRLGVTRFPQRTDLSVGLAGQLGIAELAFFGLVGLLDLGGADFSFGLALLARFDAPIPFLVVKGQVEGFVFIDANANDRRDPDESGPKDLILTLGNERARTDSRGFFRFPPVFPGTYELKIEKLPPGLVVKTALPQRVQLVAGQILKLEIPLAQVAVIEGTVFNDENRNGHLDPLERGLSFVRVFLTDESGKTRDQRTDLDGRFVFSELLPGKYTVALDARTLPENFVPTTPAEVTVELKAQERITVNFGAAERPRTVKFPPVADFTFSPERPKVGETVRFDASESFDPDGQIVKYEWDFDSDGTIDAHGVIVEHVFAQAGTFTVTLIVTDNDGETGTARKTIVVGPAQLTRAGARADESDRNTQPRRSP
jgi:plastocyanin